MVAFNDKHEYSLILKEFIVCKIDNDFTKASDFIKKLNNKIHPNYIYRLYEEDFVFSPTLYVWNILSSGFDMMPNELLKEFENYYFRKTQNNGKSIDK